MSTNIQLRINIGYMLIHLIRIMLYNETFFRPKCKLEKSLLYKRERVDVLVQNLAVETAFYLSSTLGSMVIHSIHSQVLGQLQSSSMEVEFRSVFHGAT